MKVHRSISFRKSLRLLVAGSSLTSFVRSFSAMNDASSHQVITSHLSNPSLLPLNNEDPSEPTFEVLDPSNPNSVLSRVSAMGAKDAVACIERSEEALPAWRDGTTAAARGKLLKEWSRLIQENADDIAKVMTLESGKPLKESFSEVNYARDFLDYFAAEAIRPNGFLVPTPFVHPGGAPRGQIMAIQQAVGVTALITPWNFPLAMITRKVGPALAAGCTAVVKPSEETPLSALLLQNLADQAGIPPGVYQTVTADRASTPAIGNVFCTHPAVKKISFTGSTAVGKNLMKLSSDTVKRLSLELGGNAAFVVFEDANLDEAVSTAVASKFRNAGQTCVCSDRFLIHESVHDEFVSKFVSRAKELKVGQGMDESTTMGPLITSSALERVKAKVKQALELGAHCVLGGAPLDQLGSHFFEPTVLTGVSASSDLWATETFGPVAAIRKFSTEKEALEVTNDCNVGLASYFCTQDPSRAFRFASGIECGMVGVNEGIISTCVAPFGGVKESGLGREGSPLGLSEYLETKYVFMNY